MSVSDLLGADFPELDLDLSGLEKALELGISPSPEIVAEPVAESKLSSEDNAPELEVHTEVLEENECAGEEVAENCDSDFQYDYRATALRNASMFENDDGCDVEVEPDAFEGSSLNTPSIEIREATLEDVEDIIELASNMAKYSKSPFRSAEEERLCESRRSDLMSVYHLIEMPDFGAFVARDSRGRLVGHVLVKSGMIDFLTGEEQAWIFDISVQRKHWGSGISKRLLQRAEVFARERGIRYLGLTVTVANSRALRFYQHAGYKEERYQMVKILDIDNM